MAHLSLCLLGPLRVTLAGEPVTGLTSAKARALLAYLAMEAERPHRRQVLAGLLWPERPEQAARGNLRHALAELRKAIDDHHAAPPYLLTTRETIQFNCASDCWIDVRAFEALLGGEDPPTSTQLEEATALYRGSFLQGFSLRESVAFEDWSLLTRERLQRQVSTALDRLVEHHERRGEVARACEIAWRRVELEPWQEEAHQQVMRLLALSGQRSAALAQYEQCRRLLAEELDVEPGEETMRLYERIRDGELTPALQKAQAHESVPAAGVPAAEWPPEAPSAVVSEPAPAPAAAAAVETPVAARKGLPGWVWGVIGAIGTLVLLIVTGAALLATPGKGLSSIPEAITPLIATPTSLALAAVTSSPRASALVPAIPYWVEPQEGKLVDLCKDVAPTQICIHDVKTGQTTQLTSDLDFGQVGGPAWSPDGQQILFAAGPNPEVTGSWDDKLYLIHVKEPLRDIDRSDLRQITSGNTTDLDPAWSPDGQWIAFHRNSGLWIVRPDGSDARMLLAGTHSLSTNWPAWSPDSQQIAFSNTNSPFIELWVIDVDGSDPRLIYAFERRLEWVFSAWSPDGQQIAGWYSDGREQKSLLIRVDGSGEPQIVDQTPWWWFGNFWPQWGV